MATGHSCALAFAEAADAVDEGLVEYWQAHARELARDAGFDRLLALAGRPAPNNFTPAPR